MIGELEHLGPNGSDYLVLGIDAPGFEALTLQQKEFAYALILFDEDLTAQQLRFSRLSKSRDSLAE